MRTVPKEVDELIAKEKETTRLTEKQWRFIEEYPKDLNATQAAIRAGYSKRTAGEIGWENLKKPNIQARIAKKQKDAADAAQVEAADVLRHLKNIGFAQITDYLSFDRNGLKLRDSRRLTKAQRAAIAEVTETTTRTKHGRQRSTRKFRLHSKTQALEMLGRHLDLFAEKDQAAVINVHVHDH